MIKDWKFGFFCEGSALSLPLEEMCARIKEIGYDAIELPMRILDPAKGTKELSKIRSTVEASGLLLSEAVVQLDYLNRTREENQQNIEKTRQCIETYAQAGITTLNLFTGPRPWMPDPVVVGRDITVKQAWENIFETFDILVPAAEQAGVSLAVESVWCHLCHDFFTTQYLLQHYNSPALGVNFDPSHDLTAGNTDAEFLITGYGEHIKHIHLKDAVGIMGKNPAGLSTFLFPVLGEGYVDWDGFKRGLEAIDYKGVLSVEYESFAYLERYLGGDMLLAARETYKGIQKIFGE